MNAQSCIVTAAWPLHGCGADQANWPAYLAWAASVTEPGRTGSLR